MDYNAYSLLMDFTYASIFIFIAKLLRERIKFLQEYFVPVSMLAGFMGLILGPAGFEVGLVPFSKNFGSYSGLLIIIVFVTIGLRGINLGGRNAKEGMENLGRFYIHRNIGWAFQYTIPALFALFVLTQFTPDLNRAFGMLIPAGFQGGHGTAAALGKTLGELGWEDATDLGMTSATIGILAGIFGGIIIIKWGARRRYTSFIKDFGELPPELRTGNIPPGKRIPIGDETVSPIAIDPLCWHLVIVLMGTGIGHYLTGEIKTHLGINAPGFSIGFLVAIALSVLLKRTGISKQIDQRIITRIGSLATDYLVFFGVAAIRVPIVLKYGLPFGLLMLFGLIWVVFHFTFIAPRIMKEDWFEHGAFVYGYSTGVFAIGFSLLRIVDPENRSSTLDETAIVAFPETLIEIFALAFIPGMLVAGHTLTALGVFVAYLFALIIIPFFLKWWRSGPFTAHYKGIEGNENEGIEDNEYIGIENVAEVARQ